MDIWKQITLLSGEGFREKAQSKLREANKRDHLITVELIAIFTTTLAQLNEVPVLRTMALHFIQPKSRKIFIQIFTKAKICSWKISTWCRWVENIQREAAAWLEEITICLLEIVAQALGHTFHLTIWGLAMTARYETSILSSLKLESLKLVVLWARTTTTKTIVHPIRTLMGPLSIQTLVLAQNKWIRRILAMKQGQTSLAGQSYLVGKIQTIIESKVYLKCKICQRRGHS